METSKGLEERSKLDPHAAVQSKASAKQGPYKRHEMYEKRNCFVMRNNDFSFEVKSELAYCKTAVFSFY